jgi:hypothetical protein
MSLTPTTPTGPEYALVESGELRHDVAEAMLTGLFEAGVVVTYGGVTAVRAPQDRRVWRIFVDGDRLGTLNVREIITGAEIVERFRDFARAGAKVVDGDDDPRDLSPQGFG